LEIQGLALKGYLHRTYAESFKEFGTLVELKNAGAYIIKRKIGQGNWYDAMGCYPLFTCMSWEKLGDDLNALNRSLVSFAMVADPLGDYSPKQLQKIFPDVCFAFKKHYIVDLQAFREKNLPQNHKRNSRKALNALTIHRLKEPEHHFGDWVKMYKNLVQRHRIRGIADFTEQAFHTQFSVPGLIAYGAFDKGALVGMALFYEMGERVYYHLAAYRDQGYRKSASFGILLKAILDFRQQGYKWLNLGGGAGLQEQPNDGLIRFKRGWANTMKTAWFCGKILDREAYATLTHDSRKNNFFPAYRQHF